MSRLSMPMPTRKQILAIAAAFVAGSNVALASAVQGVPPPPPPAQGSEVMSEAMKKAVINDYLLKAYQTQDLTEKIQLYEEVIKLDPGNVMARQEIDKATAESAKRFEDQQKAQAKQTLLQNADQAIAADDEAALT